MDELADISYASTATILCELRTRAVKPKPEPRPIAYSYLRFSSPAQAEGDSLRRQNALRDSWLKRHPDVILDTSLTLVDAGVSGYRGAHRTNPKHALARFLALVERGRVPAGSFLLCENLDRVTREAPVDAVPAVLGLVKAGVRVVQLSPTEIIYDADMDQGRLMMLLWELSRGHGESKMKSARLGDVWRAKKEKARSDRTPLGRICPAWLELVDGKFRVKADAAKTVRRIFQLCADGVGVEAITARLHAEGVPAIGRSGFWEPSYVRKLLRSVSVLGTYQPHRGRCGPDRKPEGEPVPNYYPAIVNEKLWNAAQEAKRRRDRRSGRPATKVASPFAGLLRRAVDGSPMHLHSDRGRRYIVGVRPLPKGKQCPPFRLDVFRDAVLGELAELRGSDLFSDPGAEKLAALTGQLSDVERRLAAATEKFEADPESQHWQNLVTKYDREKRSLVRELAEERQRVTNPLSAQWAEAVELMARKDPTRLRAALLSVVEEIRVLVVKRGHTKLCAAQVFFAGGASRLYVIYWTRVAVLRNRRRPEVWGVWSGLLTPQPGESEPFDLRRKDDAAIVQNMLATCDLATLNGATTS